MNTKQLTLLDVGPACRPDPAVQHRPDRESERLLARYQDARAAEGAHPRSIRREVGQLRALAREAGTLSQPASLRTVLGDMSRLANLLREPTIPISRSTGRARLVAAQRLVQILGPSLGRDPAADLAALDGHLPARRAAGWHATGTLVGGAPGRRRRRGPTLDAADLRRIVDVSGMNKGPHSVRDRALAGLHCFSGLRPEEVVRLRWEDIDSELTAGGHVGLTATVRRNGRRAALPLPDPAAEAIGSLAHATGGTVESLNGPVFRARGKSGRPLSYRAARDIVQDACRRAGLPAVEAASLRAACAHWLRSQGLVDHEVAAVLGLARVRSVDRLLRHHAALDAQRVVTEMVSR